ncbi:hypothetical protein F5Y19DRAFT_103534 [Xylariaceae sp. FL1651]|nr:hypothetical protein F5Y19DRAFT_103534 [Xylariaceae sp. FL1651]
MADNDLEPNKSLLERLNALKPTSISLTNPPSSRSGPASTIERAKPPSREDALTARLKSLRNEVSKPRLPTTVNIEASQDPDAEEFSQFRPTEGAESLPGSRSGTHQLSSPVQATEDVDLLLDTDDQTLEELLADLRSDETWLDELAAEEEQHQKVTGLLDELGKFSGANKSPAKLETGTGGSNEDSDDSNDDDSEGEVMTREIDGVLAKAIDEAEWEKVNKSSPSPLPRIPSPPSTSDDTKPGKDATSPEPPNARKSPNSLFELPTVPTELQEQPDLPDPSTQTQSDADFAAIITSRMAALKLSGPRTLPSAPNTAVDSLGLPVAPTFAPADRPVSGLTKRTGLTDEDQKTWCVVCLEDGAVRCLGCDAGDNVYCARCWKEMHVGPRAGYEERGHSWETFVSRPR